MDGLDTRFMDGLDTRFMDGLDTRFMDGLDTRVYYGPSREDLEWERQGFWEWRLQAEQSLRVNGSVYGWEDEIYDPNFEVYFEVDLLENDSIVIFDEELDREYIADLEERRGISYSDEISDLDAEIDVMEMVRAYDRGVEDEEEIVRAIYWKELGEASKENKGAVVVREPQNIVYSDSEKRVLFGLYLSSMADSEFWPDRVSYEGRFYQFVSKCSNVCISGKVSNETLEERARNYGANLVLRPGSDKPRDQIAYFFREESTQA